MPSRCSQCATALLVYVITATMLELYWMHPSAKLYSIALSMPPPALEQQQFIAPPPLVASSPPPPLSVPAFDVQQRSTERSRFVASELESHESKGVASASVSAVPANTASTDAISTASITTAGTATSAARTASTASTARTAASTAATAEATSTARHHSRRSARTCWKTPQPFFEPPFDEGFSSVVWAQPTTPTNGPLEDIPARERSRDWPKEKVARLERILPSRKSLESRRYGTCAVVGSSPELLLYEDGAAIDRHEAVFRANLAVTEGWEKYVGKRTTVRVINPVESVRKARGRGDDTMAIIKNQDPPAIRSPSREHLKFLNEVEGQTSGSPNFLARRSAIELCNFLLLASTLEEAPGGAKLPANAEVAAATSAAAAERNPKKRRKLEKAAQRAAAAAPARTFNLTDLSARFRRFASGESKSWHPHGDGIPRFSPIHCSTGTVLLVQALLTCKSVRLYGYHACSCAKKCADTRISARNHYWDKKETPRFGEMMSRYEHHMLFYQLLERACDLDFRIARNEHCDA